jgi:RNA methyltransferase, TrmH family
MSLQITSPQNQRIKDVVKLGKRGTRDSLRLTVVEGIRECSLALAAGKHPQQVFLCPPILQDAHSSLRDTLLAAGVNPRDIFEVTRDVFAKLAYRGESGGIVLVLPYFARGLQDLHLPTQPLLLVLEGIEKPGNLGAILRTADAAGVHGVIVTAGATDIHNPNAIRASLGAIFTVPVVEASSVEAAAFLHSHQIHMVAATPHAEALYWDINLRDPVAIILGSEAEGLSQAWLDHAQSHVRLPMYGAVDSLNLSTATSVILYEALRQRSLSG